MCLAHAPELLLLPVYVLQNESVSLFFGQPPSSFYFNILLCTHDCHTGGVQCLWVRRCSSSRGVASALRHVWAVATQALRSHLRMGCCFGVLRCGSDRAEAGRGDQLIADSSTNIYTVRFLCQQNPRHFTNAFPFAYNTQHHFAAIITVASFLLPLQIIKS